MKKKSINAHNSTAVICNRQSIVIKRITKIGQCGILMNQIWTKARKMMNLQKWYLEGSDHPQISRGQTRTQKEPSYQKMSQIGQRMSELAQNMRHGAWPAIL